MKFIIDTHMHTIPSGHAYSTIREMAEMGKEHGLEAIVLQNMVRKCRDLVCLFILKTQKYSLENAME